MTVTRGKKPSCIAWCVSEKAPEMSACEAMTVAAAESTTSATVHRPETSEKNGLAAAAGLASMSAPCPK